MIKQIQTIKYDFIIIGAGFFGLNISKYLRNRFPDSNILVVDKESDILLRASRWNQARVHMGYHYPRSVSTAIRSSKNYNKFLKDWGFAVNDTRKTLYGISKINSKTNTINFEKFLKTTSLSYLDKTDYYSNLFNSSNISKMYEVFEDVFSAELIRNYFSDYLKKNNIDLLLNSVPDLIESEEDFTLITINNQQYEAKYLFNCTYSGIGKYNKDLEDKNFLKHEIAEIAFVKLPPNFDLFNITIMDGPFFSIIYNPDKECHTLSHVRYTPHFEFFSKSNLDPYKVLENYDKKTNFNKMKLDSSKYFPGLKDMQLINSFFEIKTVLNSSEINDSREILINKSNSKWDILGSKIDQVYDVLSLLDEQLK